MIGTARPHDSEPRPDPGNTPLVSPDRRPLAGAVLLVVAFSLVFPGCGGGSPGDPTRSEEHTDHVIPAHKPKDFPSAIGRLRELNGRIADGLAEGKARSLVEDRTLPMAVDIANWLPEIAADSELPESPWNQVADRSATLVASYKRIAEVAAGDDHPAEAPALSTRASADLKALETLLDSADPLWFDSAKPGAR